MTDWDYLKQPSSLQPYRDEWPNRPTPEQIAEKHRRIRTETLSERREQSGINCGCSSVATARIGTALLWLGGIAVVGVGAWAIWELVRS